MINRGDLEFKNNRFIFIITNELPDDTPNSLYCIHLIHRVLSIWKGEC